MSKVLYASRGRNYRVPRLAYGASKEWMETVILDSVPDVTELRSLLDNQDAETIVSPWSIDAVRGFKDYLPTTFRTITKGMPRSTYDSQFSSARTDTPEKLLLQLQTEVSGKAATIDAAIINSRRDYGTVVSKVHQMNRLYQIGRLAGALGERDYPLLFGLDTPTEDPDRWDDILSEVKQLSMKYLIEMPAGNRAYPQKVRTPHLSDREIERSYPYISWLKEKLGDDLIGVLLYGSAARTDDPSEFGDFDNWVRVRNVGRAHRKLRGTNPFVYEGKVVEGHIGDDLPDGGKHVGVHLFPESEEYLLKYIRFLHDSREFLHHTKVLHGDFPFTKVAQDEIVLRGLSAAYMKLKTAAGGLNWAYTDPRKLIGKEPLFDFFVKISRFFLQHALNATGAEPEFRDKSELNRLLAERGMSVPTYSPDPDYIRECMLESMVSVLSLQGELLKSQVPSDFSFLTDGREFAEWNGKDLNKWPDIIPLP